MFIVSALLLIVVTILLLYKFLLSSQTSKSVVVVSKFQPFEDKYHSLEEVSEALREAGLESSNLIIGIDYTASNMSQGRRTFGGRSLHEILPFEQNLYQRVITVVGRTLAKFDEDGYIPCFGFGDIHSKDFAVFPLCPEQLRDPSRYYQIPGTYCNGFDELLQVYSAITPYVRLSGPTNFAPLIYKAIEIVMQRARPEYHILVIIADGQVVNEKETENAIVEASKYPLSIIVVGVGDGPWDMMEEYDDKLPKRKFDNFQFVNYEKVTRNVQEEKRDVNFALAALMEIPDQYKTIRKLGLLSKVK
jgi:E3 ubiquitin-protein ligase RGLG